MIWLSSESATSFREREYEMDRERRGEKQEEGAREKEVRGYRDTRCNCSLCSMIAFHYYVGSAISPILQMRKLRPRRINVFMSLGTPVNQNQALYTWGYLPGALRAGLGRGAPG